MEGKVMMNILEMFQVLYIHYRIFFARIIGKNSIRLIFVIPTERVAAFLEREGFECVVFSEMSYDIEWASIRW
jgi:hypothetical protein